MTRPTLHIRLFETLQISSETTDYVDLGSPKAQSLLAYLILNHTQSVDRRRLAFIFWPRATETAARRNLRQYLHRVRRALEPIDPHGELLTTAGHHISFDPPEDWTWTLDVEQFEAACQEATATSRATAVSLYRGDLLADVYDDWVIPERERLAALYRENLLSLIDLASQQQSLSEAIRYAHDYVTAEPLLENGYVRLMKLYYRRGDRGRVKQVYDQLVDVLDEDLDATPLPETTAVYEAMMAGDFTNEADATIPSSPAMPVPPPVSSPSHVGTAHNAPFIGRAPQQAWLANAFEEATHGRGGVYLVRGESGIGKSRLIEAWRTSDLPPHLFLHGRGYEFENMIPYNPLTQSLRHAADQLPWDLFQPAPNWLSTLLPLLPDLSQQFPSGQITPQSNAQHHTHIIEALGNLLLTLARHQPVILYIDNLHWADLPTWNFLAYLAPRARQARLLLLGTVRTEDMSAEQNRIVRNLRRHGHLHTADLPRFTHEETAALVIQLFPDGDPPAPLFIRRIYEETEGNPFFIIETIRAVREAGGDWTASVPTDATGQRPAFQIPLQVQAVIESRLDKLSDDSRTALGVAAAIGRAFTFSLLQEVSQFSADVLVDAIDEWLERGLVQETSDGYDFTHEKLSQVAYNQLSRARRQWVHFQIATYLQRQEAFAPVPPAQLAHHFYLSHDPAQALPYLARAGERALSVRSYATARTFGLQAIGLLGRFPSLNKINPTERIDLNLQLAQAYAYTGALPKALQLLQETERTAESVGDTGRLATIFYRSAQIFWLRGEVQTAADYARRLLRHAEESDNDSLRLAALRMLGRVGIVLSTYDDAIAYLLRYINLAESSQQPAELPVAYGYLAVAYARVGSWERAIDAAERGIESVNPDLPGERHIVARMQAAFVYADLQEWKQALSTAEPVQHLWREMGMTPHAFMLRVVVGRAQAHLSRQYPTQQAVAEIEKALHWAQEVDHRVMVHTARLYLAQAQLNLGAVATALNTAVQATEQARQVGDRWAEAVSLRVQAECEMRQEKPDWAGLETKLIRAMHTLRRIRARPDLARTYLTMRRLYDRAGQIAWAVDCHFRATTIFSELGMMAEHREAQGQPASERTGAVVIPGLQLLGPNVGEQVSLSD